MTGLAELMSLASAEMALSLARTRAALTHSLTKGEAAEESVRTFLRRHLPPSIGVTKGQIVDSLGQRTKQLDIIIFDRDRTPILFTSDEDDNQLIPSEGALAVVEVKTHLYVSELPSIVANMQSVKTLDKSAYVPQSGVILHETNVHGVARDHFPTLYFVFAFESGDLARLAGAIAERTRAFPTGARVDMLCVLAKGVICNLAPDGSVDGVPTPDTQVASYETQNALLLFYLLASRFLLQARTRPIALQRYLPTDFRF